MPFHLAARIAIGTAASLMTPTATMALAADEAPVDAGTPAPDTNGPSWYQKKKADLKKKETEPPQAEAQPPVEEVPPANPAKEATEVSPKPILEENKAKPLGEDPNQVASELSAPSDVKQIEYNLLFSKKGLTASGDLGFGLLSQPEISGFPLSGTYSMGWWWKPELVLSGSLGVDAIFASTYSFMLVTLGPNLRFFPSRNVALRASISYGFSQGSSRVPETNVPPPPSEMALIARRGFIFGAQGSYLFWKKRNFAIGPALGLRFGSQGERSVFEVVAGVTFQDGRPEYDGDLTEK